MQKLLLLTVVCLSLFGCKDAAHKNPSATGDGLEPLAYTIYTQHTELFVEFKPLVVGQTSKFAAHFTKLGETFLPLTEGRIAVRLVQPGQQLENSADTPSNPGIFRLALQPKVAGMGRLEFDIVTKDYKDHIVIDSVVVYPNIKAAIAAQPQEAPNSNEISYLKEQAWKIEFANAPVTYQPFNDVIRTTGQLQAAPGDEVTIAAKSDGVIHFSGKATLQGASVQAGQSLFSISGGGVTGNNIDAAIQTARAEFAKAKADYDRAKELVKDQLVSQRDYKEAELRYRNSQTQLNTLTGSYGNGGKTLATPISGFVKNIGVVEGQFVTAGQPVATIAQNKNLMLRADVSQRDFGKVAAIQSANFITTDKRTFSTKALNGKVLSIGRNTAENSMMLPVFFEIDNTVRLVPGSVVEVYLQSVTIQMALLIPVTALIEEQGRFYAYVQTAGESFEKRELQLGATDGMQVQILKGIEAGERVVTKGAYQIRLATMSGTMPAHGHEH